MILFFNNDKEFLFELSKDELKSSDDTLQLNDIWTSDISYPYKYHRDEFVYFGYFYEDNYYQYKITDFNNDNGVMNLTGIHMFFDDMQGKVVRDVRPQNATVQVAADRAFTDTDWVFTSSVIGNRTTNFYHISYLDAFYKILETWNCEFDIRMSLSGGYVSKKEIILKNNISKDYGKWYEYGSNLVSVIKEEKHSGIFTAFIGRGKGEEILDEEGNSTGGFGRKIKFTDIEWKKVNGDPIDKSLGQDYIEIVEATKLYGYDSKKPREITVDFDDIEDKELLIQATYEYALENSRPKLLLKTQVHDNALAEVGEIATIIRDDLKIRYKTKIIEIRRNLLTDTKELKVGDPIYKSAAQRLKEIKNEQENQRDDLITRLESAFDRINRDFWTIDSYDIDLLPNNIYGLPSGRYSFDRPIDQNPTKVTYIGASQVLISDSKKPDGSWDFRYAITPDGIYGSEIISNSITANKLASDVGQQLDLSSNESINLLVQNQIQESKDVIFSDTEPERKDVIWYDNINKKIMMYDEEHFSWSEVENQRLIEQVNNIRSEFVSYQEQTNEILSDTVSKGEYEEYKTVTTDIITKQSSEIKQEKDRIETTFETLKVISDNLTATEKEVNRLVGIIRSGQDETTGEPYTEWITNNDEASKVRVTSGKIELITENKATIKLENGIATVTSLYVDNILGLGNHTTQTFGEEFTPFAYTGGRNG